MFKKRKIFFKKKMKSKKSQMDLGIRRSREPDRNLSKGGRSFYFFDFDDNIAFLSTPIYIKNTKTGEELELSSGEFASIREKVGKESPYLDYKVDLDEQTGSYRHFRDFKFNLVQRILGRSFGYNQSFVKDMDEILNVPPEDWQGPSWSCFYHAVYNLRPISIITARGHHPKTIKEGISRLVKYSYLPNEPNYLSIFPVSHMETKKKLMKQTGDEEIAVLKQEAIRSSVLLAIEKYGDNPHHRFGMSDDDPTNLRLITEEMLRLKSEFPKMSFFVFSTEGGQLMRREIFAGYTSDEIVQSSGQLDLFDS